MAWSVDQANIGTNTGSAFDTSIALTTTQNVAAGSWIFVAVQQYGGGSSPTMSGGGLTWETVSSQASGSIRASLCRAYAPSGLSSGATLTASLGGSAEYRVIAAAAFAGAGSDSPTEDTASNTNTNANWTTGTLTSLTADALIVCHCEVRNDNMNGSSPTSPSVEDIQMSPSQNVNQLVLQHRIVGTAGDYTSEGTWASPGTIYQQVVVSGIFGLGTVVPVYGAGGMFRPGRSRERAPRREAAWF